MLYKGNNIPLITVLYKEDNLPLLTVLYNGYNMPQVVFAPINKLTYLCKNNKNTGLIT
jgi:hypothetical protein